MVDIRHGVHIYHWKHGWIPLDHFAALKKAHGSERGAEHALAKAHAAGHVHRSFASTATHRVGHGAGAHLRAAEGFQPVAAEHLRRDKNVVVAFHPVTRNFHLLDLRNGHTAVISEDRARELHMNGHKITGISKSESGGNQLKVHDFENNRDYRLDAQRDHLQGVQSLRPKPHAPSVAVKPSAEAGRPTNKPASEGVMTKLARLNGASDPKEAAPAAVSEQAHKDLAAVNAKIAALDEIRKAIPAANDRGALNDVNALIDKHAAQGNLSVHAAGLLREALHRRVANVEDKQKALIEQPGHHKRVGEHQNAIIAATNREQVNSALRHVRADAAAGKLNPIIAHELERVAIDKYKALPAPAPNTLVKKRGQMAVARALQAKGRRLRNVDRLKEHRANVVNADIGERERGILLRQVDLKLDKLGARADANAQAAEKAKGDAEALKGGAVDQHFESGGSIINAPSEDLFKYLRAHPERFDIKGSSKNGQVSQTFKITDKKTHAIVWRKDDGQAEHGAIKEKLAADLGNQLGFFKHRANMDITNGDANHVVIENAPKVEGFGERNRFHEAQVGQAIAKGSDPSSFMKMVLFDYLIANDEDRHYMNFHLVDEGGGKMRTAILDHGRAFGGAYSNFHHADRNANFTEWFHAYERHSARGWDAQTVGRNAYPEDHNASQALDKIIAGIKGKNIDKIVNDMFTTPGMDQLSNTRKDEWAQMVKARIRHITDEKNKGGIIKAIRGI